MERKQIMLTPEERADWIGLDKFNTLLAYREWMS